MEGFSLCQFSCLPRVSFSSFLSSSCYLSPGFKHNPLHDTFAACLNRLWIPLLRVSCSTVFFTSLLHLSNFCLYFSYVGISSLYKTAQGSAVQGSLSYFASLLASIAILIINSCSIKGFTVKWGINLTATQTLCKLGCLFHAKQPWFL